MDIERDRPNHHRRNLLIVGGVGVLVIATMAVSRIGPAVTTINRDAIAIDVVKRGDMVRDVRAPGTLVAEHVRLIVATTGGRIEALPVRPGEAVTAATTLVQLANPDVALAALQMKQQLIQAYAGLAQLRTSLQQQRVTQQGAAAQLRTQSLDAERSLRVLEDLDRVRSASRNEVESARERVQELKLRYQLEQTRSRDLQVAEAEQLRYSEEQIAGLKRIVAEQEKRAASMRVTAGENGQLLSLGSPTLELGQWVNSGYELARISRPGRLKAVLRVPETLVRDLLPGQRATIDTRDGLVEGRVLTVDPTSRGGTVAVEVAIDDVLPRGARADVAIDGAIEIERMPGVLHAGRPAYGAAGTTIRMFRIVPNRGEAVRVNVQLGRASTTSAEIRGGLVEGDSVFIGDMTTWLSEAKLRLKKAR